MPLLLILVVTVGVGLIVYFMFIDPAGSKMPSLEQDRNDRLQRESSSIKSSLEKSDEKIAALQKELEAERGLKRPLEDEMANLKAEFDKMRSECDLLKIENSSLKGKYMEKDREHKKHLEELKLLREKIKTPEEPKTIPQPITPPSTTQAAPKNEIKKEMSGQQPKIDEGAPIAQKPASEVTPPPEQPKHDHASIAKFMEDSFKEIEKSLEHKQETPAKPEEPGLTNLRLVEDDPTDSKAEEGENDDKTTKDKDIQDKK